jgi:hypothetical protein
MGKLTLTVAALLLSARSLASSADRAAPATQPSPLISGVSWDFQHLMRQAHGSDLWPVTWAADGDVYTGWGDGGGFEGDSDSRGRVSLGFARISGVPPDVLGANVWGDHKNGFAKHQATFGGKPVSMLSVDGVLYAFITSWGAFPGRPNPNPPYAHLAWSPDAGATWTQSPWKLTQSPGHFYGGTFVNFGRDYAGAHGSFVYIYGAITGKRGAVLARVEKHKIKKIASYEFFAGPGPDGQPTWKADPSLAQAVFTDPDRPPSEVLFSVVCDAPLHRYLATWSHDGTIGRLWLLDAPRPWGPWTIAAAYDDWGRFGHREALLWSIPTKWISSDGKTFWCIFSAGRLRPDDGLLDSFNLVRATLTLKSERVP